VVSGAKKALSNVSNPSINITAVGGKAAPAVAAAAAAAGAAAAASNPAVSAANQSNVVAESANQTAAEVAKMAAEAAEAIAKAGNANVTINVSVGDAVAHAKKAQAKGKVKAGSSANTTNASADDLDTLAAKVLGKKEGEVNATDILKVLNDTQPAEVKDVTDAARSISDASKAAQVIWSKNSSNTSQSIGSIVGAAGATVAAAKSVSDMVGSIWSSGPDRNETIEANGSEAKSAGAATTTTPTTTTTAVSVQVVIDVKDLQPEDYLTDGFAAALREAQRGISADFQRAADAATSGGACLAAQNVSLTGALNGVLPRLVRGNCSAIDPLARFERDTGVQLGKALGKASAQVNGSCVLAVGWAEADQLAQDALDRELQKRSSALPTVQRLKEEALVEAQKELDANVMAVQGRVSQMNFTQMLQQAADQNLSTVLSTLVETEVGKVRKEAEDQRLKMRSRLDRGLRDLCNRTLGSLWDLRQEARKLQADTGGWTQLEPKDLNFSNLTKVPALVAESRQAPGQGELKPALITAAREQAGPRRLRGLNISSGRFSLVQTVHTGPGNLTVRVDIAGNESNVDHVVSELRRHLADTLGEEAAVSVRARQAENATHGELVVEALLPSADPSAVAEVANSTAQAIREALGKVVGSVDEVKVQGEGESETEAFQGLPIRAPWTTTTDEGVDFAPTPEPEKRGTWLHLVGPLGCVVLAVLGILLVCFEAFGR